jgi:apolipoprotein N-acyltransferase
VAAAALPPIGVWPLGIVGIALLDQSLAGGPPAARARRGWLAGVALLGPGLLWMHEFTVPGWAAGVAFTACLFALGPLVAGGGRGRWLALPGGLVLVDALRAAWPFDGVPVATLDHTQIGGPLAPAVRLGGPLLLTALVVLAGVALSAAWERAWRTAVAAIAVVAVVAAAGWVAPHGTGGGSLRVALVQGGGERGTRAVDTGSARVFAAHLAASERVERPVDVVLWPEDVVDVDGDVARTAAGRLVSALAEDLSATLVAGVVEGGDEHFRNWAVAWGPGGEIVDRYEKNVRVPFGEWIPFRSLVETVADVSDVPRDAAVGHGPGILRTPAGDLGVLISWEVFFARRSRAAVNAGGQVVLVPTNASSFEGEQMPAVELQVARLRALETGRWVEQAAPTGFTGVVDPDGRVRRHGDLGGQAVLHHTVGLRTGRTPYAAAGDLPVLAAAAAAVAGPPAWARRRRALTPRALTPR